MSSFLSLSLSLSLKFHMRTWASRLDKHSKERSLTLSDAGGVVGQAKKRPNSFFARPRKSQCTIG